MKGGRDVKVDSILTSWTHPSNSSTGNGTYLIGNDQ